MTLVLFNTMTGVKEEFKPINDGKVKIYACGITVYDSCHPGHARSAVAFDVVHRWLKHKGYEVTFVQNYTDIDDKIINRANKENRDWKELTTFYINEYEDVLKKLNVLPASNKPKATEYINEMIKMIEDLESNGLAYKTESGVYFSVKDYKNYGKLSKKPLDELESGARVSVDEKKNNPMDFALWKFKKPNEPFWPSPWGEGRPGWHIECSVMSTKILGQPFDIHGGGRDLIFPHHENEIAQAEGAHNKEFAKYWMHNGFLNINSEKMSKSLGNFVSVKELLEKHDPESLRYFLLSAHYRSPLDYSVDAIKESESAITRFYETLDRLYKYHPGKFMNDVPEAKNEIEEDVKSKILAFDSNIENAMDDDFNSAKVLGYVFDLVRAINRLIDVPKCDCGSNILGWMVLKVMAIQGLLDETLGIFGSNPAEYLKRMSDRKSVSLGVDSNAVESLINERYEARKNKNFAKADEIRDQLLNMGVVIKDVTGGKTEWKLK